MRDLLKLFKIIGESVPLWTQGQGSNLSYKCHRDQKMYIKPSGFRLDQVQTEADLVVLDLNFLDSALRTLLTHTSSSGIDQEYASLIQDSKIDKRNPLRPSMETGFHTILSGAYVLHFHSIPAVIMGHYFKKNPEMMKNFFTVTGGDLTITVIPYSTPGFELTQEVKSFEDVNILILQNHGVILNSDDRDIIFKWRAIEEKFCKDFLNSLPINVKSWESAPTEFLVGPIKVYFPDFAVYLQRLLILLRRIEGYSEEVFAFDQRQRDHNKDLYELWFAHCILYYVCPELDTLTSMEVEKLCGLPTEKYRLMLKQGK